MCRLHAKRRRLWLENLETRRVLATVDMVRDINQQVLEEDVRSLYAQGNNLYFSMSTPATGPELWLSNGSAAGTSALKKVYPTGSYVTVGATTYFAATDYTGTQLYKTNGTAAGTVKVKDINPSGDPNVSWLTVMGGIIYFQASDGIAGGELWRSDGTEAGTFMVKDIRPGPDGSNPHSFEVVNGLLFFAASTPGQGTELWRSDGTSVGTFLVKDIWPLAEGSQLADLTNVSGTLYFSANDGTHGNELWKSDGTPLGTVLVEDINSSADSSAHPAYFTNVNGTLFFRALNIDGYELWKSNGTIASTVMVKDINPNFFSSMPRGLTNVGGTLYFSAKDNFGYELWKSNGTSAGTVMLKDIAPAGASSNPRSITNVNGIVYFTSESTTAGTSLWSSNGTSAGTVMVESFGIDPADNSTGLFNLINANGKLYFVADQPEYGQHLWKSDGTTTERVVNWTKTANSTPAIHMARDGMVWFSANQFGQGRQLWQSDGSYGGTKPVKSVANYEMGGSGLLVIDQVLYFVARTDSTGYELWRSDGTDEGTYMVKDILVGTSTSFPSQFVNVGGTLYFTIQNETGPSLWKSNGTASGTLPVVDGPEVAGQFRDLVNLNGKLYFSAVSTSAGRELWTSDGTESGTMMVRDIAVGSTGSNVVNLQVMNGAMYFGANDDINGFELWKSDGTFAGTVAVSNFDSSIFGFQQLVHGDNRLFFYDYGDNLWTSNGTLAGTQLLKSLVYPSLSGPPPITMVGDTAYFQADQAATGFELWKSDGTVAGTVIVKDIQPGIGSAVPTDLTNVNGKLFFAANDGVHGSELWVSDGTPAGTYLRSDIASGGAGNTAGSSPNDFTVVGSKLFMTANSTEASRELFMQSTDLHVALSGAGPYATTIRKNGNRLELVNDATSSVIDALELEYVRSITFEGTPSGADTLTIDYSFGGFFALPDGLHVAGATGADTLNIVGVTGMTAQYVPSGNGLGNASILVQQGNISHRVDFTGFEGLSVTNMLSVSSLGTLAINGQSLNVGSVAPFNLGNVTQLSGAVVTVSSSVALGSGEMLVGSGNLSGRFSGEVGSLLVTQGGSLTVGSSTSVAGFLTHGEIQVVSSLLILDANQAVLGELTTLGTAVAPASLLATNGLIIDFGNNVVGYGTLNTTNSLSKALINNGTIAGNSAAQPITLTGFVKGVGSLSNVNLAGTYSPGLSPAMVNVGSVNYGPGSTTVIELGGLTAGAQYDQINHDGQAVLGGMLDIDLIDNFVPQIGDVFTILTATGGVAGTFSANSLPTLPADREWKIVYSSNAVEVQVIQLNVAPTDIQLLASSITENSAAGSVIGSFTSQDANSGNTFVYTLVSGAGSSGNSQFTIDAAGQLKNVAAFNYEASPGFSIRVRSTDQGGLFVEKNFTVSVVDLPELVGLPQFGDGSPQRSMIERVAVTFEGLVDILPGAFSFEKRGVGGGAVDATATATVNGAGHTVVTLTFSGVYTRGNGVLEDGYYQLTVHGGRILRSGNRLDTNQDGIGGDTYIRGTAETDNFFALYGDVDGDGVVGVVELGRFRNTFGKSSVDDGYDRQFDYDGNGNIGVADFGQFRNRFGKPKLPFA